MPQLLTHRHNTSGSVLWSFLCQSPTPYTNIALLLLVSPGAHHRLLWRRHDKERLLRTANVLAITGSLFLGIAVTAAVYLVTQRLNGGNLTAAATAVIVGLVILLWYGIPLTRRLQR